MTAVVPSAVMQCPACESTRTEHKLHAGGVSFLRCRDCNSLFDPNPGSAGDSLRLYDGPEYFMKANGQQDSSAPWGYANDYLADRAFSEVKFERILDHLERYVLPGRLLDVGSGPGFLLTVATRRGWSATGIDVNRWAADYGREQLGVDIRAVDLAGAQFRDREFDALTMMDMVEHVGDPEVLMAEAARVVAPGGAIAILTPDAGSPISRLMGARWPEVRRAGEHAVLYSARGLAELLSRSGFAAYGWHPIGKVASLATLAADVESVAPRVLVPARRLIEGRKAGETTFEFDPGTKFCLYARRLPDGARRHPGHRPVRIPKRPDRLASVDTAILEELQRLAAASGYCDWMFEQFSALVRGHVAEIGAGIGTFSQRILNSGAESLLAVEPDPACAEVLGQRFSDDPRVQLTRDELPGARSLAARSGQLDLVVCQNVLEHIGDDVAALVEMRRALRPEGNLALLVPAHARLYGALDEAYGHWRRYDADDLGNAVRAAGFQVVSLAAINAVGVLGWWAKNHRVGARIGPGSFAAYEAGLPLWKRLERLVPRGWGLSLACIALAAG